MATKVQHWRNRIVSHGEERPDQLLANPRNWRIHPKHQQQALEGVLSEVGWIQDVIVNKRTGFVLDGHLRVGLAISTNQPAVPVKYVDLDEDEETLVLATFDPLAALAVADREQQVALLNEVTTEDTAVQELLAMLVAHSPYEPNLDPTIAIPEYDANDVAKTQAELEGRFDGERPLEQVMCPHCGGKFYLDQ